MSDNDLLICAALAASAGWVSTAALGSALAEADKEQMWVWFPVSLDITTCALWLAYAAGGA